MTAEQAERLNRHALIRRFSRHTLVYSPSQPNQSVLIVVAGRVKIKDVTPNGKETILAFLDVGELFGEQALLDGAPHREYAEAVVDSQVLLLPRDDMLALINSAAGRGPLDYPVDRLAPPALAESAVQRPISPQP